MLKTVLLPLALMIIMFGMGMTLTLNDFKRVILSPKAKMLGLFNQLVLLVLVAFGLVHLFRLSPELAVGLMLVAACPGGPTSNIISHLSKGDTALSVTLTAISSVVTVFTIPLIMGFSMRYFMEADQIIEVPFVQMMLQLMLVTIVPISAGMVFHAYKPQVARRATGTFNVLSILFLALIIIAAVLQEEDLGRQFIEAGPAALTLNLLTMTLGFYSAALLGLPKRQRISISIESGIQNGTLALAIALGILASPRIAMPAVVYSLLMFMSGGWMIFWYGRRIC